MAGVGNLFMWHALRYSKNVVARERVLLFTITSVVTCGAYRGSQRDISGLWP